MVEQATVYGTDILFRNGYHIRLINSKGINMEIWNMGGVPIEPGNQMNGGGILAVVMADLNRWSHTIRLKS